MPDVNPMEEVQRIQRECKHTGHYIPGGQQLLPNASGQVFIAQAIICSNCGFLFIFQSPTDLRAQQPGAGIVTPQMRMR